MWLFQKYLYLFPDFQTMHSLMYSSLRIFWCMLQLWLFESDQKVVQGDGGGSRGFRWSRAHSSPLLALKPLIYIFKLHFSFRGGFLEPSVEHRGFNGTFEPHQIRHLKCTSLCTFSIALSLCPSLCPLLALESNLKPGSRLVHIYICMHVHIYICIILSHLFRETFR